MAGPLICEDQHRPDRYLPDTFGSAVARFWAGLRESQIENRAHVMVQTVLFTLQTISGFRQVINYLVCIIFS